ncbi:MAG TPA: outer membrane lipoprotein carrier protein LolA [Bacteroidales bacterium]|nr:outer membrane lipoprotein carrier protein LolA [Bacteroidales bacterium]HSA42611.1 outer membrane lipoprotein carrier protein LolA [Bacteroidales bacterium]
MRKSLLAALFILPFLLQAQTNDTKAKSILDELIRKSKTYQTIKAEFTYKLENKKNKVSDSYQGSVMIKGNRYRLSVAGQTVIYNNNTVWTYIKSANEVQINSTEESEDAVTPTNIFDGSYLKNFKPKYISEGPVRGKTVHIIDMIPLKGKSYFKVRLEIEKSNSQIASFAVYDKNGSVYSYIINKFQTNMNLNDDTFVFRSSEFPGAEINDMR